jgi:hypothetical protein
MGPKTSAKVTKKRKISAAASTSAEPLVDLIDSSGEGEEAPSGPSKKSRSENWNKDEQLALVNSVAPVFEQLFGKHSQSLDEGKKAQLWKEVSDRVKIAETSLCMPYIISHN